MKMFYLLFILSIFFNDHLHADDAQKEIKQLLNFGETKETLNKEIKTTKNSETKTIQNDNEEIKTQTELKTTKNEETVNFNYDNEDITNVVNKLAAKKRINIVFPQPTGRIPAKITFTKYDMTIDEAWDLLVTSLDLAGYTIVKKNNFYEIEKNEEITREPLEVYVNAIDKLPDSDQRIRYIYFLENISIAENSSPSHANLEQILKDMIGNEADGSSYILDGTTNSIIIVGRSSSIKGVMKIIEELDTAGFPEAIEVIPLVNTKAEYISRIISQLIPGTQEPQFRYGPFPPKQMRIGGYYISEQTKVVPIDRTNSIAIMGPPDSVQRIKEFVEKNLDLPITSEKSVIHVKTLQYLNADEVAPAIQDLVKARSANAQAEAITSSDKDSLANVIVVAEKQVQATAIQPTVAAQQQTVAAPATAPIVGGNRLIVAARAKDWHLVSRLIDQLDQPQLQVALEVLVCDISLTDTHAIGAQLRNSLNCGNHAQDFNFQSVQLTNTTWLNYINNTVANGITPQGLASDLLRYSNSGTAAGSGLPGQIARASEAGSTIFSFENGNGISLVFRLLQDYTSATILSQPFVITKNNLQANISIADERFLEMGVDNQSTGGPIIRQRKPVKADLTVNILPRISKSSEINLEIVVNVNDFQPGTASNVITTRQVRTNANLKNKEVLVIGGLARVDTNDTVNQTPLLGRIPIIGSLFRNKTQLIEKNNLMIFIAPTIIRPRLQGGVDSFTKGKIDFTKNQVAQAEIDLLGTNFDQLKDPITRVFFAPLGKQINAALDYYSEQKAYQTGSERLEVAKEISLVGGSPESVGINRRAIEEEESVEIKNKIKDTRNPFLREVEEDKTEEVENIE